MYSNFRSCKLTQFTVLYTLRKFLILQQIVFRKKYESYKLFLYFGFTLIRILRFNEALKVCITLLSKQQKRLKISREFVLDKISNNLTKQF